MKKKDLNGYVEFMRDKNFVLFQKGTAKDGYYQIKVKRSDIKNGNYIFMLKNGLSR